MSDLTNKVIGGFRILREIQAGSGSQGTVYKAECIDAKDDLVPVGTVVALKVMVVQDEGKEQWRKLEKRTTELARLNNPNVVRYFGCFSEAGLFNDVHVVVQEFLRGETLKERLTRFPSGLDVDEALKIADAALSALVYTSGCGIIHRDIKPGNVFLCDDGTVKLIDFEIARQSGGTTTSSSGNIRGSFDYMAPDFTDAAFYGDVQSDVFSMGVLLHEMLTGKTPYQRIEGDDKQANFAFLSRWARSLADGGNPIHVSSRINRLLAHTEEVMRRSLAPRREDRYADFEAFREGLKAIRFRDLRNGPNAYRMLQFIGKGGFGEVFKARVRQTGKLVAVKHLLKANYSERFYREAKIMKKLHDPCFVQFVDFFMMEIGSSREAFLVMAFLDGMPGSSLRDALKGSAGGGLPRRDVFRAFERYARGLRSMHAAGIFHRDIKPSNLYFPVGRPEAAAIMDLGIARDVNGTATHGQVPGTLDYMPPEVVVTDSRGDGGMDIYALGLCFYEALTSKTAFPRLPTGSATYAAFFDRARSKRKPAFDDADVCADPELLALLADMTNPELSLRLRDAGIVLERIRNLRRARFPDEVDESEGTAEDSDTQFGDRDMGETVAADGATQGTVPAQWGKDRIAALERERKRLSAQRGERQGRTVRRVLRILAVPLVLAALGTAACVAWEPARSRYAELKLDELLAEYQAGNEDAGARKESAWRAQWDPKSTGWLKLDAEEYGRLAERLESAKRELRAQRVREEEAKKVAEDRQLALDRLASCLTAEGGLDEGNFRKLEGWSLPQTVAEDEEIRRRLTVTGAGLASAIDAKMSAEPLATRHARIREAKALLGNSWTARMLSSNVLERLTGKVTAASAWSVGIVTNCCQADIQLDGRTIVAGGSCVACYEDGHPENGIVSRQGYEPIRLPKDFDGKTHRIEEASFVAKGVVVAFPPMEGDVRRLFGGKEISGAAEILLKPGKYEVTYSRGETYEPQTCEFSVRPDVATVIPSPGEWKHTKEFVDNADKEERKKREEQLAKLRDGVRDRCSGLMANEPVESRQDRLGEASRELTKAVTDGVMSEGDAQAIGNEIARRKQWVVGKVRNTCAKLVLSVGGESVGPGETKTLVFAEGLPKDWCCRVPGYEDKELRHDFDGRLIEIGEGDLVARRVIVPPSKPKPTDGGGNVARPVEDRQALLKRLANGSEFVPNPPTRREGERMSLRLPNNGPLMSFRWCPPGRFLMGSPDDELFREGGEQRHLVTLTNGFWIGETEVTREQWKSLMGNASWSFSSVFGNDGLYPIAEVSWDQCQEFCNRFTKLAKRTVRLPTEAEWEYACRAGTATPFSFGQSLNGVEACCAGQFAPYGPPAPGAKNYSDTVRVRSFKGNPWGIYDMHGNVYEWCSDWYVKYEADDATNPTGPEAGSSRVVRGGCWMHGAKYCRAAYRGRRLSSTKDPTIGFRVCLEDERPATNSNLRAVRSQPTNNETKEKQK